MPIKIQDNLPAKEILKNENIFIMDESRAFHQDIRPLKIAILNLMPLKQVTEVQLLRLLGNSPLQIDIKLLNMKTHYSKNTSIDYLENFYNNFSDVEQERFDGLVITGAPVEKLDFGQVTYWNELTDIMEWSKKNVTSTLHICWGAQAGLYYHYGIPKYDLPQKLFGIFPHTKDADYVNLLRGFDDVFCAPHSRHTEIKREDILKNKELSILSESETAGVYIVLAMDGRQIFVTGHSEYDCDTLKTEYFRDLDKGLDIQIPINYFKNDDPHHPEAPKNIWRSHANLLFSNWLNYYVYQETPYDLG